MNNKIINLFFLVLLAFYSCGGDKDEELLTPYFFNEEDLDCNVSIFDVSNGIFEKCLNEIFLENFDSDNGAWALSSEEDLVVSTDGGYLKVKTKASSEFIEGVYGVIPEQLNSNNMEYEFHLKFQSNFNNGRLISWGMSDVDFADLDAFFLLDHRDFIITRRTNETYDLQGEGKIDPVLNNAQTYILKVRRCRGKEYYFFDDKLVFTNSSRTLSGSRVFLGAGPGTELWVDKIRISEIEI